MVTAVVREAASVVALAPRAVCSDFHSFIPFPTPSSIILFPSLMNILPRQTTAITIDNLANVDQTDTNVGSALNYPAVSASQLLNTFVPVLVYAVVFFVLFLFLRPLLPRIYSPRVILKSLREQERSPKLPGGWWDWFTPFFHLPDTHVLETQSLDSYLFLRHLRLAVIISLVGMVITWPILIPVNATGPGDQRQLNRISMSNAVSENFPNSYFRYFAHTFCAYLFFGFLLFLITRESIFFINLRQAYLVSPLYADRISSRTVMYNAVPKDYLDETLLREMLGKDLIENIWIPRDTKELEDLVDERDKLAMKLENAETSLIRKANGVRLKKLKEQSEKDDQGHLEPLSSDQTEQSTAKAGEWLNPKKRPKHRLGLLGLFGEKVDTIDWCRAELRKKIPQIEKLQKETRAGEGSGKVLSACFVQFKTLRSAQDAYQSLTHHQPLHMSPRFCGVFPSEIIWSNLRILWWERVIRFTATTAAIVALIIFWSFPVGLIGAISSVTTLIRIFKWLGWIQYLPSYLYGVVSGLLPAVLLALLFWLLPVFLRLMASIGGAPTKSDVEYQVQNSYFAFQVVQVFLVTTLSSGAVRVASQIVRDPTTIFGVLGQALPQASNFYYCYFTLQGLGVVSQTLLSISTVVVFWAVNKFLNSTPRKMYKLWTELSDPQLGTLYPIYTNLLVIAICYACIAPMVLLFSSIGLYLFYLAYRYNFLFVYTSEIDLKGLMYARALQQLFVGIYLAQICMIGIFAVGIGGFPAALGPFVLMVILLVFTAIYHISLNEALQPLLAYLPKTLETEERRLLALEEADLEEGEEIIRRGTQPVSPSLPNDLPVAPQSTGIDGIPPPKKKPSMLQKFFRPDVYTDYYTMRKLVPRTFVTIGYDADVARRAYYHPAVYSETPTLWIPKDPAGVSEEEIRQTPKDIPISNKGAYLDEKNHIKWDLDKAAELPVYEEKIYY